MNRINRKIKTVLVASTAIAIITGGAVTYGFQGVLASLGLLFLLAAAGAGIHVARKARLYAKALKYAEWVNTMEVTPVSTDDKKWITKHLDEYFKAEEEIPAPVETAITRKDKQEILNHLDGFIAETLMEQNTITLHDKEFIMENVDLLFDNNREEDRQTFA
jgi:uncharacterized membrane protein required for colicin V production